METLSNMWEKFSLTESEGDKYQVLDSGSEPSHRQTASVDQVGVETELDCNDHIDERNKQGDVGGSTVDNMREHAEEQMGPDSTTAVPKLIRQVDGFTTNNIVVQSSQVFQAQVDAIDEDLARYDTVEEGRGCDLKVQSGGVGAKVVGSAKFLTNLFTQTEARKNILRTSKHSQRVRTSTSKPVASCLAKRMRAWDCTPEGTPMFVTASKLKRCKQSLKLWSREHFGNVKKRIKEVKDRLWRAEDDSAR
nr:hypothetical protein CFP56_26939 [Quercus suber]